MIHLIFCLHRLPSLTREQFQHHWREHHAPLVRRHAPAMGVLRYAQYHTFEHPALAKLATVRGGPAPYDGVAQLSWESLEHMLAVNATPEGRQAGQELLADEKRFIDLARSPIFFVRENVVVG